MADSQDTLNRLASGYLTAGAQSNVCPHCGKNTDDVPEPDAKSAADMQKGATESGIQPKQWLANLKSGLGMKD